MCRNNDVHRPTWKTHVLEVPTSTWKHLMQMCEPGTSGESKTKSSPSAKHSPGFYFLFFFFTSAQTLGTLTFPQAVNVLSVMLERLYEIHRPQTTSELRDIDSPIRAERATWIASLMRYEVDSRRGGGRLLSLPSSFLPLPGVLQITSPDPGVLASDWPQQAYLPNKACLIGPQETMACVNSPGALDSRPTQQSLC